jgi:hypothetical protein
MFERQNKGGRKERRLLRYFQKPSSSMVFFFHHRHAGTRRSARSWTTRRTPRGSSSSMASPTARNRNVPFSGNVVEDWEPKKKKRKNELFSSPLSFLLSRKVPWWPGPGAERLVPCASLRLVQQRHHGTALLGLLPRPSWGRGASVGRKAVRFFFFLFLPTFFLLCSPPFACLCPPVCADRRSKRRSILAAAPGILSMAPATRNATVALSTHAASE